MYLFSRTRFSWFWTATSLVGSVAILLHIPSYFLDRPTNLFLLEKGNLRHHPLWISAFYLHVLGSSICLATGPLLMFGRLIRVRNFHRGVGYVYLNAVLWFAAPAGLVISPVAKAGFPSAMGFMLTGVLWWIATWNAYGSVQQNRTCEHIRWAVRSYAIALSAVFFRFLQTALSVVLENEANYVCSVWLSLIVSLIISESFSSRLARNSEAASGNTKTQPTNPIGV